jgi:hypothetical protein
VALQHERAVAERLGGGDRGLDVAAHLEEIVGVDVLVVLSGADRQRRITPRRQGARGRAQRQFRKIAAAAMHLHQDRRLLRRLSFRLPQRRRYSRPVGRGQRQKAQSSPRQRLHVVRQPVRPRCVGIGDAGCDLRCAFRPGHAVAASTSPNSRIIASRIRDFCT